MIYTYIELESYKRFSLNRIDKFTMTLTSPLQLVLGSNGCGKSSLLSELSPLPAHHADFHKSGKKVFKLTHNHYEYTLKSIFAPHQKHSFLRAAPGEEPIELNEGGTAAVQRELVKHQFGFTSEIHEFITGKEPFDRMSPARRKEWFITLCETNYDYAIKVYNRNCTSA